MACIPFVCSLCREWEGLLGTVVSRTGPSIYYPLSLQWYSSGDVVVAAAWPGWAMLVVVVEAGRCLSLSRLQSAVALGYSKDTEGYPGVPEGPR